MELHAAIGARILSGSTNELLARWPSRSRSPTTSAGTAGATPNRLAGEAIPLAGPHRHRRRRVRRAHAPPPLQGAVAGRVGRPRDPRRDRARSFDPRVTAAFARLDHAALVLQPASGRDAIAAVDDEQTLGAARARTPTPTPTPRPPESAIAASRRSPAAARSLSRSATRAARRRRPVCACRTSASPWRAARACAPSAARSRACARPARRACPRTGGAGRRARAWSA